MIHTKKIVFLIGIIVLAGCTQGTVDSDVNSMNGVDEMTEVIENGDTVKIEYVGTFPDTGEEFDKSEGRGPLEFVVGAGQMIKGFDKAVVGMALNEEKTVQIPPEEAYGKAGEGQTTEVPVEQIGGEEVKIGTPVSTNTGQQGKVTAINNGVATVMFEHPLAGKRCVLSAMKDNDFCSHHQ